MTLLFFPLLKTAWKHTFHSNPIHAFIANINDLIFFYIKTIQNVFGTLKQSRQELQNLYHTHF